MPYVRCWSIRLAAPVAVTGDGGTTGQMGTMGIIGKSRHESRGSEFIAMLDI